MFKKTIFFSILFLITFCCQSTPRKILFYDTIILNKRTFAIYSPGTYTPMGLMIGRVNKNGHGIYSSLRFNFQIFRRAKYHFEEGAVDDRNLNWYFTGEKKYSRWEVNVGGVVTLFTLKKSYRLKTYFGAGLEKSRYLYSFSQTFKLGNTNNWVEYKEIGGLIFSPEAGILFSSGENLNFQIGVSTLHKKHERMITFGIGIGLNEN